MCEETNQEIASDDDSIVEEADKESFPASDPPARTVVTGIKETPLEDEPAEGTEEASFAQRGCGATKENAPR